MENLENINFTDTKAYRNKKFIKKICQLTDEQAKVAITPNIIEFISTIDLNTINYIFRNSSATMQYLMWQNDRIQRLLLCRTTEINDLLDFNKAIRDLENLSKIIKSPSIKRNMYSNIYFLYIIMKSRNIEPRFFHTYDLKKVFDTLIASEIFNNAPISEQLLIIEKLNTYTKELLLPPYFRKRYPNIERLLMDCDISKISPDIMSELNEEELFFLNCLSKNFTSYPEIFIKYIKDNLITKDKSFTEFLSDITEKENNITRKLRSRAKHSSYYYNVDLKSKMFKIILESIEDDIIKEKLLNYIVDNSLDEHSTIDRQTLYVTLKRNLDYHTLTYKDISNLTYSYGNANKELRIAFYIKFNIALMTANYLVGLNTEQILKLNVKHINKLVKLLEDKSQDELSAIYGIAIKLYFIFGYERSLEILNGKFGEYNKVFLDNVAKTDVTRVSLKQEGTKYLPDIDKRFINFMFETPKNNHFISMLKDKTSYFYKRWSYLYNNYDEILEKCHNEITLKKVLSIMETDALDINRSLITPDMFELNNIDFLENIILGNKTHYSNNEILETIVDIYGQMKKRVESSIPYVEGIANNGYHYQMLKLDDQQIFTLGYKANCCIRTKDIAHNHLLHAALCRNGRVLVIYDRLGDIAAFSPLKRNGNVLIANSIECVSDKYQDISSCFQEAIEDIIYITRNSEEPLDLALIGSASTCKPPTIPFPDNYPIPTIYEKEDEIYAHTDIYHKKVDIIYKHSGFSYEDITSYNPTSTYLDPRPEPKYIQVSFNTRDESEEALNIINSINYSKNKDDYHEISKYSIREVYYSKDWYIALTYQGIIGEYLSNDYRALEEYTSYMNKLSPTDSPKILEKTLS